MADDENYLRQIAADVRVIKNLFVLMVVASFVAAAIATSI